MVAEKSSVVSDYLELLRNRTFTMLALGQFVAFLGSTFFRIALFLSLLEASHAQDSYVPLLGLSAVIALAYLLFGPLGGVFVDTWDRRWTMIVADLTRAILLLWVAVASPGLWRLYLVAFLVTVGDIFFEPAREASMPNILTPQKLFLGNSFMNMAKAVAETIGYYTAGVAVEKLGLSFGFYVNAVAFIFSAAAIFAIRIPTPFQKAKADVAARVRGAFHDLKEGMIFIRGRKDLLTIFGIFALMILGGGSLNYIIPIYNSEVLHRGAAGYGTISASITFGFLIGSIIIGPLGRNLNKITMLLMGLGGMGICIIGFGLAQNYLVAIIALFLAGMCNPVYYTASRTYLQELVPNQVLGRVFSFQFLIIQVGSLASMLMVLGIIRVLGVVQTVVILGLFLLLAVEVGLTSPALREVRKATPEVEA